MTRRALAAITVPLALALAACGPTEDPDRCVPPSPSPTGAPWVEADDGEACTLIGGSWTERPDDGHKVVPAPAWRVTTVTAPARPTTRINPPAPRPARTGTKARTR